MSDETNQIIPFPLPPEVTPEERARLDAAIKKRGMELDFQMGANTKHLRLPGGLRRPDK